MFTEHPNSVCMTYLEHFNFSMKLALLQIKGAYKAIVHAIIPNWYITSTTDINKEIKNLLDTSGCNNANKSE